MVRFIRKYAILFILPLFLLVISCFDLVANRNGVGSPEMMSEQLGFTVDLPDAVEGKLNFLQSKHLLDNGDPNSETINTLNLVYRGEKRDANLLIFEEMSTDAWKKMQQENSSSPLLLGTSDSGRVVIAYPLQSNPYEAGTADAEAIDQFCSEFDSLIRSFRFTR